MKHFGNLEVWFVTGSQNLYGQRILDQVAENSEKMVAVLTESSHIPINIIRKPTVKSPEEVFRTCQAANTTDSCVGLIFWMHTFSPAKMWIAGLNALQKPFMHLHTQFNDALPWGQIDMDFMNLNQSAHGGREFGFLASRLRKERKVVVGHWQDVSVQESVGRWGRAAAGWHDCQSMKVARFGDNMREVAVTEGNKVSAQIKFGYSVHGYGMGDLWKFLEAVSPSQIDILLEEYFDQYAIADTAKTNDKFLIAVKEQAQMEIGIRGFLEEGGFSAFTDTFEDLHGLQQLPGLATQRLMAEGYGFGAEGDWKTAALLRTLKFMSKGLEGGCSFMEDYTYHFNQEKDKVLGSHMLEVCPSIADPTKKARMEVHPLSIGGKADPARLVFDTKTGPALNATLLDMGNRFRLLVNEVEVVKPEAELPNLPVARAVWEPQPSLKTAAAAWILAGGAHHTAFSQNILVDDLEDFAEIADIEMVVIDEETKLRSFKKELKANDLYYSLARGLVS